MFRSVGNKRIFYGFVVDLFGKGEHRGLALFSAVHSTALSNVFLSQVN